MTQFCSGNALRTKAVEYNEATFSFIHEHVPACKSCPRVGPFQLNAAVRGQKGQYNERQCQEAVPDNLTKVVAE